MKDPNDIETQDWVGIDMRGADTRLANLEGTDLRGADPRRANLRGADTRLANLRGADLWGLTQRSANLRGANLRSVDLGGTEPNDTKTQDWAAEVAKAEIRKTLSEVQKLLAEQGRVVDARLLDKEQQLTKLLKEYDHV